MKILLATLASALVITPMLFAQGVLAPTGAPGPLMKSLDQIEPRIPISSLPYTISTSGSYYFTQNLQFTAAGGSAITISANDVTLDLSGFTLSSTAAVTGRAIDIGSVRGVIVKNGCITGNTTVVVAGTGSGQTWTTTPAGFGIGIMDSATGSHYQELGIRGCRSHGLYVSYGINTIIDKVSVSSNGDFGIVSEYSGISNCTATSNGGIGIFATYGSVANTSVNLNGGYGILANSSSVTNVTATFNGNTGISASYGSVSSSTATTNGNAGITSTEGNVTSSTARGNISSGIEASAGSVTNCTAILNGGSGITAGFGSVTNSIARSNGGVGIEAGTGSVTNSSAFNNTGTDLFATNAVVAFCKAGTRNVSGSTLTGNLPTP